MFAVPEGRDSAFGLAHLTLLLVEVARLNTDVVGEQRLREEPLLARVFGYIEEHYNEPISLKDVARAVNLSASYLTTVVGRKTGRTVLGWISERRLEEARRLLVETDLAVGEVGLRAGYGDPAYFARSFRRAHGITPLGWRRAGRVRSPYDPAQAGIPWWGRVTQRIEDRFRILRGARR